MPRIKAATLKEHNEQVLVALVDATEELLRDRPGTPLTAAAVAGRAGIARNSIYKHVASVDDLRGLVVQRHIPGWASAVESALQGVEDPAERVRTWARVNLQQAALAGHGWLMGVAIGNPARAQKTTSTSGKSSAVDEAHDAVDQPLRDALERLVGARRAPLFLEMVRGLAEAGMRRLDAGDGLDEVAAAADLAVRGLLTGGSTSQVNARRGGVES